MASSPELIGCTSCKAWRKLFQGTIVLGKTKATLNIRYIWRPPPRTYLRLIFFFCDYAPHDKGREENHKRDLLILFKYRVSWYCRKLAAKWTSDDFLCISKILESEVQLCFLFSLFLQSYHVNASAYHRLYTTPSLDKNFVMLQLVQKELTVSLLLVKV